MRGAIQRSSRGAFHAARSHQVDGQPAAHVLPTPELLARLKDEKAFKNLATSTKKDEAADQRPQGGSGSPQAGGP